MTIDRYKPLLDRDFLKSQLAYEYEDYKVQGRDAALLERLRDWADRQLKRETQAEGLFTRRFFEETWGYLADAKGSDTFHLWPRFSIEGAGQGGNRGEADLAVGNFGSGRTSIPQIVCEYKDTRSSLDKRQNRKGNDRSPVMQARDYLWNARRGLFPNDPVQPRFAVVTDMDEFRLYWWEGFPDRYLRFKIAEGDLFNQATLLGTDEDSRFDRFLFQRLFRPDMLLSSAGRTKLERLIERQGKAARKLEGEFYDHYRKYREVLIANILPNRPKGVTKGGAVRLAQRVLDRLIFLMFAEDMGFRVGFPPGELTAQLRRFSGDALLEADGNEVWSRLKLIFERMNTGGELGDHTIHKFNGGLFAEDEEMNALVLPNRLFVRRGQAQNEAKTAEHKETLFFLAGTYNFAREGDARKSIGLYTLGHIFEQSIVELEALEARAEGRLSLTELTKRKRDGVYYTPEWAVQRIVEEVLDPLFAHWRSEAGWSIEADPSREAALAYWERLCSIRVLDPACGSGAFLIVALRHLEAEFARAVAACRETGALSQPPDADAITDLILTDNLWGLDINAASVEITKLSLWLHHLRRKGKNLYTYRPQEKREKNGKLVTVKLDPVEVRIEDELMKPLVSGRDAKRFLDPRTDMHLLFPYDVDAEGTRLFTPRQMAERFPFAWKYLSGFEAELRARDGGKTDKDDRWFGYVYPKNLDKQETTKLLVPRLVSRLACFADDRGRYYCDNVDVGGVIPRRKEDVWLLAGIINAPVTNLTFSWLSKPFRGDYRSANKQFIAPLPVPRATLAERAGLSALARGMQERRTAQVDEEAELEERLAKTARRNWPLEHVLPDVRPVGEIEEAMPKSVRAPDRKRWIDEERKADEEAAFAPIDAMMRLDSEFAVTLAKGRLSFLIDDQEAAFCFVGGGEGPLVEAQWRAVAISFTPTGKDDAGRLVARLRGDGSRVRRGRADHRHRPPPRGPGRRDPRRREAAPRHDLRLVQAQCGRETAGRTRSRLSTWPGGSRAVTN